MVICLERGADMYMALLMSLPLTVSWFSKIQIGFTFLVLAHLGSPRKGPLNGCVCVTYLTWEDGTTAADNASVACYDVMLLIGCTRRVPGAGA